MCLNSRRISERYSYFSTIQMPIIWMLLYRSQLSTGDSGCLEKRLYSSSMDCLSSLSLLPFPHLDSTCQISGIFEISPFTKIIQKPNDWNLEASKQMNFSKLNFFTTCFMLPKFYHKKFSAKLKYCTSLTWSLPFFVFWWHQVAFIAQIQAFQCVTWLGYN